jgi:hypothetical protein
MQVFDGRGKQMTTCKYCGKPAGFLSFSHPECRREAEVGKTQISALAHEALIGNAVADLPQRVAAIAANHYVDQDTLRHTLIEVWTKAVNEVLEKSLLDQGHEHALIAFTQQFNLTQADLDAHGAYMRLGKAAVLRDVVEGKVPDRLKLTGTVPFNLQKNETLIWLFKDTAYLETRTHTEYVGRSAGVSVRVVKGVYYHTSAFRGRPIQQMQVSKSGNGLLGVTDRNLFFTTGAISLKIPYSKIVTFHPYSDGIGIQRDAKTAKPEAFVTGDGWFTYNLIANAAQL